MRRICTVVASGVTTGLLLAATASADVTVTATVGGRMSGGDGGQSVVRIKGNKMRNDLTQGNNTISSIFDLDAGKMITLDHKKKEAIVMDVATAGAVLEKVKDTDVQVKVTPTSETKTIAGHSCTVLDSDVKVAFAPAEGMSLAILMNGPVCVSKNAPGQKDYSQFYMTAVEKGFFFTDPRAAKAQPGPAKGFAQLYKAWAEAGVPLSSSITLKFDGGGMMAGLMNKMAGGAMTSEVTNIDTASIADDQFAPPAGYKVKTQ